MGFSPTACHPEAVLSLSIGINQGLFLNSSYQRKLVSASDTAQSLPAKATSFAFSDTTDGATGPLSSNIPFGP
jgi:hypothetical protein